MSTFQNLVLDGADRKARRRANVAPPPVSDPELHPMARVTARGMAARIQRQEARKRAVRFPRGEIVLSKDEPITFYNTMEAAQAGYTLRHEDFSDTIAKRKSNFADEVAAALETLAGLEL